MGSINTALIFLSNSILGLYITILMIRLLMFRFAAYYPHPICRFIYQSTDKLLKPFNKISPLIFGFETGTLLCIYLFFLAKIFIVMILSGQTPSIAGMLIWAVGLFLNKLLSLYFFLIIAFILISWIMPFIDTTLSQIIGRIVIPILYPIQRILPPIGGIDISPLLAIILIQTIKIALIHPIIQFGTVWAI